jgi:hypothetical protein
MAAHGSAPPCPCDALPRCRVIELDWDWEAIVIVHPVELLRV